LRSQVDDLEHVAKRIKLIGDLLQMRLMDINDAGNTRAIGTLGGTHRNRHDIETPAHEQSRYARQHTGSVFHQNTESVLTHNTSSSNSGAMSRAILMSSLLVPAATIGHTMASRSTTKSMTTGASLMLMALLIVASRSAALSHRRPTHPNASARRTKSGIRRAPISSGPVFKSVLEYRPS